MHSQLQVEIKIADQPNLSSNNEQYGQTSPRRILAFKMHSQLPGQALLLWDLSGTARMQIPGLGGLLRLGTELRFVTRKPIVPGIPTEHAILLDPVLHGTELFFQALYPSPNGLGWSNLEKVEIR
jgi:hypothetical protein